MSPHLITIEADGDTVITLPSMRFSDADAVSDVGAVADEESVVDDEEAWADVEIITDLETIANEEVNTTTEDSIRAAKRLKLSNDDNAEVETGATEVAKEEIFHFQVSMRHLVSASPRAKAVLQGPFKESTPHESDGLLHWELEPLFDPIAFEIVMRIIHAQNDNLPEEVTIDLLANIAAIVDDLQCRRSVRIFASWWAKKLAIQPPSEINIDLARSILISSVFGLQELFESSTLQAVLGSNGNMPIFELPISSDTLDAIEDKRKNLLKRRLRRLHTIAEKYNKSELCLTCRAGSLGLMHVNMHANDLPMTSSSELVGISLRELEEKVKSFVYPPVDYRKLCKTTHKQSQEHPSLKEDIDHFLKHFYSNMGKLKLR